MGVASDVDDALTEAGASDTGHTLQVRLTGYWPFSASAGERTMEGGKFDTHSNPLHTLEDAQSGAAPYCSVSGDDGAWPYGQRISIDQWPDVVFRVVDTGGHFRGTPIFEGFAKKIAGKWYRIAGREPLDICVNSSATKITPEAVATVFPGDDLRAPGDRTPATVQADKFVGQQYAENDVSSDAGGTTDDIQSGGNGFDSSDNSVV